MSDMRKGQKKTKPNSALSQSDTSSGSKTREESRKREFIFLFKLPRNRGNQTIGQARWEFAAKKRWMKEATLDNMEQLYRWKKYFPLQKVRWVSMANVRGAYDFDNLVSLNKWPFDWMRDVGVIVNDNRSHCWPRKLPDQVVDRKGVPLIAIHLTDVSP